MKVDSLSIHFKMSMISSRTKHESFNSFGSHTQFLIGNSPIFIMERAYPLFSISKNLENYYQYKTQIFGGLF